MKPKKILVIIGTRPDAIKMAQVIKTLRKEPKIQPIVVSTSQHREMLNQVLELFTIEPDFDLKVMTDNQTLCGLTEKMLSGLNRIISDVKPQMVLVQGDTTTAFAGSLAAFYHKVPIGHIEAGLRSADKYNPYPEEINRRLITVIAELHFAPTETDFQNLLRENIEQDRIFITGNTVIDSLLAIIKMKRNSLNAYVPSEVLTGSKRIILITAHRRENWGAPLENICFALLELLKKYEDIEVIFPVHLNPNVRQVVFRMLNHVPRIHLIEPLSYDSFVEAMDKSYLILTDSGGVQEEAPSLGKPVLVLRNTTERFEGVAAGTAKIIGTKKDSIVSEASKLLEDIAEYQRMSKLSNPYGDGTASKKIVQGILYYFGMGLKPDNFTT